MSDDVPKTIWSLWLQGWGGAPEIVLACQASWQRLNPDWQVQALDLSTLEHCLGKEVYRRLLSKSKEPEALSDQVRIELLARYGGVWVDATAMCAQPLDSWLPASMPHGFFAFSQPSPDRMLSSWFLASHKDNYIVEQWLQKTREYWEIRKKRDDYFWFHSLFRDLYDADSAFRELWEATPKLPAQHLWHFGPQDTRLTRRATEEDIRILKNPTVSVYKLTHKLSHEREPECLNDVLCRFARGNYFDAGAHV
jgi:hypothetical protein